jgi:hypothetical protein
MKNLDIRSLAMLLLLSFIVGVLLNAACQKTTGAPMEVQSVAIDTVACFVAALLVSLNLKNK